MIYSNDNYRVYGRVKREQKKGGEGRCEKRLLEGTIWKEEKRLLKREGDRKKEGEKEEEREILEN